MPKEISMKKSAVEKPRRRTKKGKKKDPNAPKKNLTAFFFFSGEMRDKVKEENPGAKIGTVSKILGEKWKQMDDAAKLPYVEKAKADKIRYEKDIAAYRAGQSQAQDDDDDDDDE